MHSRRIVGAVLLLALMGLLVPSAGEARMHAGLGDVPSEVGLLERLSELWAWAEGVLADLGAQFATKEGSAITSGG